MIAKLFSGTPGKLMKGFHRPAFDGVPGTKPLACLLLLSGCMVGPDYHRPPAIVSPVFKELRPAPGWQRANPAMAELQQTGWWQLYNDPVLSALEQQVSPNNQNIKTYEAKYRQARALIDQSRSSLFPTLSLSPAISRDQTGPGNSNGRTSNQLEASASWDLDVWGRVRRQVESDVAGAQASAADVASATLSYQALLAEDYFNMRTEDELVRLYQRTIDSYQESLRITQNQYDAGYTAATPTALLQARTQVEQTRASLINTGVLRSQYEHAIAVLTGQPPAALTLAPTRLADYVPAIPVTLPAIWLQRRPDIAAAERAMQQENALIGVQVAAFFPDISLSATYGWMGDPLHALIQSANRVWSLGATATQSLFEGGLRSAELDAARAQYDNAVASYRQTVLGALQDTEDDLSGLRILAEQAVVQARATALAEEAVRVSLNEYRAGTVDYTTVVTNEVTALTNEQSAVTIQQQRLVDSVRLIEQMGGGWRDTDLPNRGSLQTGNPFIPSVFERKAD